jgi:hypothetical protein
MALTGDGSTVEDFTCHLFSNNYTVVDATTLADFTQATFTGYSSVAVARADFSAPAITSNVAYANTSAPPTFTCTGGSAQLVYGWYLVGDSSGKVYAAQNFAAARNMATGATEQLDPFKFGLQTLH